MAKPKAKPEKLRGIYENPEGSGVYWILYYENGVRHREKAGTRANAQRLLAKRRAAILEGRKLPELKKGSAVTISDLIDLALQAVAHHKDRRNYISKAKIVREAIGDKVASEFTPQDLDKWLKQTCKTPATSNRYKAFVSLCYREGIKNRKVTSNPARELRQRKEGAGRLRYLSKDVEYPKLLAVIEKRFPEHVAEFVVSVHTGMRLSEQFSAIWKQYDPVRRAIELTETKNGSARTVHLGKVAFEAIESLRLSRPDAKPTDRIFPREGSQDRYDTRSWFVPCLKEAGIEGYVWHCNRHTFCSWLAIEGASLKQIQELAGHKTISMSARYAHLSPENKFSVLDKL